MTSNFPTTFDALSNPAPTDQVASVSHSSQHTNINDIIEAIEAKLGIGVSTPGGSAGVLRRSALNTSMWGQVQSGDYASGSIVGADIAAQTITGASVGAGMNIGYRTIYGGQAGGNSNIALGSIDIGDITAGHVGKELGTIGPITGPLSSFDFGSISTSYKHLRLYLVMKSSINADNDTVYLRVNGAATAGVYYGQAVYASTGTPSGTEQLGGSYSIIGACAGSSAAAGVATGGLIVVDFPGYALGSVLYRQWVASGGFMGGSTTGKLQARIMYGMAALSGPITSIQAGPLNGGAVGSYAALYGVN